LYVHFALSENSVHINNTYNKKITKLRNLHHLTSLSLVLHHTIFDIKISIVNFIKLGKDDFSIDRRVFREGLSERPLVGSSAQEAQPLENNS